MRRFVRPQRAVRAVLPVLVLASAAGLAACTSKSTTETYSTTTGQELLDLEAAYKEGVITEKEFEKKKKEILRKR